MLELRRLNLTYTSNYTILSLSLAVSILQCQNAPHKLELYETTSLIAVYLAGIFYHLQWLMLAPFQVSNVDLPTFTNCIYS